MYKKILVPMALDHGVSPVTLTIARKLLADGGKIEALHVFEAGQASVAAYLDKGTMDMGMARAKELLAEKLAGQDGVTGVIRSGHAARVIVDYAKESGVDCIVIGSHMPGLSDFLIGSTAARVVRHVPCAVHVHRSRN